MPDYQIRVEIGFLVPAGTPRPVIDRLNGDIVKVLNSPDVAQRLRTLGIDPVGSTSEQYARTIRDDLQTYGKFVRDTGARVD